MGSRKALNALRLKASGIASPCRAGVARTCLFGPAARPLRTYRTGRRYSAYPGEKLPSSSLRKQVFLAAAKGRKADETPVGRSNSEVLRGESLR